MISIQKIYWNTYIVLQTELYHHILKQSNKYMYIMYVPKLVKNSKQIGRF